MSNCAEIYVINKLNELTTRHGLSPMDAEFNLVERDEGFMPPPYDGFVYTLTRQASDLGPEKNAKLHRMWEALGFTDVHRVFHNIDEVNDAVDQALKLAPRALSR